ncbi:hypothetical protein V9T40_002692 [Parthenolecanium corni]|uniref:Uncharacterized protein n=1 Tax=Parthenolecanium corni TaxID=536013 RepID=A0AAN9Y4G1_9HEMI
MLGDLLNQVNNLLADDPQNVEQEEEIVLFLADAMAKNNLLVQNRDDIFTGNCYEYESWHSRIESVLEKDFLDILNDNVRLANWKTAKAGNAVLTDPQKEVDCANKRAKNFYAHAENSVNAFNKCGEQTIEQYLEIFEQLVEEYKAKAARTKMELQPEAERRIEIVKLYLIEEDGYGQREIKSNQNKNWSENFQNNENHNQDGNGHQNSNRCPNGNSNGGNGGNGNGNGTAMYAGCPGQPNQWNKPSNGQMNRSNGWNKPNGQPMQSQKGQQVSNGGHQTFRNGNPQNGFRR